jgi:hypothetical protein
MLVLSIAVPVHETPSDVTQRCDTGDRLRLVMDAGRAISPRLIATFLTLNGAEGKFTAYCFRLFRA